LLDLCNYISNASATFSTATMKDVHSAFTAILVCAVTVLLARRLPLHDSSQNTADDLCNGLELDRAGGRSLSSFMPLWEFPDFMTAAEVNKVLSSLPHDEEFDSCNRTIYEHKTLGGRRCAKLRVEQNSSLQSFLVRLGKVFQADLLRASHLAVIRYAPGAPGVPVHIDKNADKSRNALTLLIYLTTASHSNSGLTMFEKVGVSVRPKSGTLLAWSNQHANSEHSLGPVRTDELHDRIAIQIGLDHGSAAAPHSFELSRTDGINVGPDFSPDCGSWCNVNTCRVWGCLDCAKTEHVCAELHQGRYCSGWCNKWTTSLQLCSGCLTNSSLPSSLRGNNGTEAHSNGHN